MVRLLLDAIGCQYTCLMFDIHLDTHMHMDMDMYLDIHLNTDMNIHMDMGWT